MHRSQIPSDGRRVEAEASIRRMDCLQDCRPLANGRSDHQPQCLSVPRLQQIPEVESGLMSTPAAATIS
jgi:hypothetical protein